MSFSQFQGSLMGGFYPPFLNNQSSLSLPWQQGYLVIIDALIENEPLTPNFWQKKSPFIKLLPPSEFNLMILPLLVYYHDDLLTLKQKLDILISVYSLSPSYRESLYLFASAIAACLRRQDTDLISQLIENYPQFNLTSHLIWLQNCLLAGTPLNQLIQQFPKELDPQLQPFLIALFAISDTPEMPHLAVLRVHQTSSAQTTMGLTGALLGAMGSLDKLPKSWQLDCLKIANEEGLVDKIKVLWQQWTGNLSNELPQSVATPLVMQSRPSLKLISQEEYLNFPTLLKKENK